MNNIECENCIKRKTMYCPNSIECYETENKPYWKNRIMVLEENQKLKEENRMLKQSDKNTYETSQDMLSELSKENKELHNKIDKLTNNLENSINSINAKLGDKEIRVENGKIVNPINDYRTVRLKAIRMKCKELREILKSSDVDE